MEAETATIRELRLNFRSIKRKIEQHGSIVITDNGIPSFELKALPRASEGSPKLPDYYSRLMKQRGGKPISAAASKALHRENRGER